MAKKFVMLGFFLSFLLAIYVYWRSDRPSLHQALKSEAKQAPRLILENFTLFRYRGDLPDSQLSANLAQLFEPNIVELAGEIMGVRIKNDEKEVLEAETATIFFDAKNVSQMMQSAQVVKADISGFVQVRARQRVLSTEAAEYTTASGILKSKRPVRIDGKREILTAEDGFVYEMPQEKLSLKGRVKGVYKLNGK